jgi:hypothetical protein
LSCGGHPAEWLALRAGLVPAAAADAWGGMALSGVAVAAVRPLAVLDAFAEPDRRASAHADMLALFVYLSSGARAHAPRGFFGWLRDAGFAPPRRIRILRIPSLSLRVATKSGSP